LIESKIYESVQLKRGEGAVGPVEFRDEVANIRALYALSLDYPKINGRKLFRALAKGEL